MIQKCRECPCEMLMLKHFKTGKINPIEAAPADNGNLVIDRTKGIYRFATKAEIETAKAEGKNLYISHFARCAFAGSFRK